MEAVNSSETSLLISILLIHRGQISVAPNIQTTAGLIVHPW
jgi:hypothetical protein